MAADDWIKMRVHLRDDPGTVMIQAKTGLDLDTIVGKLHRFWSWADAHVSDGARCARCAQKCAPCARCSGRSDDGFAPGIAQDWVDAYLGHPGFAAALVDAGWARFNAQGIVLPRYASNNGSTGKGRAQAAKRQARRRGASRPRHDPVTPERDNSVTRAEPDKSRGEEKTNTIGAEGRGSLGLVADAVGVLVAAGVHAKVAEALARGGATPDEIREDIAIIAADKAVRQPIALLVSKLRDRHGVTLPKGGRLTGDVRAFARHIEALRINRRVS